MLCLKATMFHIHIVACYVTSLTTLERKDNKRTLTLTCVSVCLRGFRSSIEEVPPSPVSRTSSVSVLEEEEVPEVTEVSSSDDLRPLHTSPDPSFGTEVKNIRLLKWLGNANTPTW